MIALLGRGLCRLGLHDFRPVEITLSFGPGGGVARLRCRRCGRATTRRA